MGQVTWAIDARSALITSSDTTPERRHQSAATPIQQTTDDECGNNVLGLALSSHIRELIPNFGSEPKCSIGPLPLPLPAALTHMSYVRPINRHLLCSLAREFDAIRVRVPHYSCELAMCEVQ